MKCELCGTENLEGSSFCKKCGKNFKEEIKSNDLPKINEKISQEKKENPIQNEKKSPIIKEDKVENVNNEELAVYCECGQKLNQNWKFCPKCKSSFSVITKNDYNEKQEKDNKNSGISIYICLFAIGIACGIFLNPIGYLVSLITIITGKIKCPHSAIINVLFYLTIVITILYVIMMVWVMITCMNAISSCISDPTMGCPG